MSIVISKRIEWLDVAKGISIFLVVIGHTGFPYLLISWLGAFRMPFFFFVSGMCFNFLKYSTFNSLFTRRCKTLIKPYLIFTIIVFFWAKIINYDLLPVQYSELYLGWNGIALWFIPVLFSTELLFYFITSAFKTKPLVIFSLVIFSLLGYTLFLYNVHVPFKQEVIFSSVLFYGIGNLLAKKVILKFKDFQIKSLLLIILAIFPVSYYFGTNMIPRLDMAANIIGSYIPTYFIAFIGILLMFSVSNLISRLKFLLGLKQLLLFLGKNTFVILALHQVILMSLKYYFESFQLTKIIDGSIRQVVLWIILSFIILFVNNYTPSLVNKKK